MPQRKPEVTRRTAAGIPYELTRKKVNRLNLHIRRDGTVAVSIPWSYTVGFADAFVTEQAQVDPGGGLPPAAAERPE